MDAKLMIAMMTSKREVELSDAKLMAAKMTSKK
jgi:hypothetical protein